jgi:hypothetical protein
MSNGQGTTVSPATITTLVGVLYHALEGIALYDQAIADAQHAGNQQLVSFLQQVQQEDQQRAATAQQLVAQLAGGGKGNGDLGH